jgi:N-acetylglucosaminyldiphosphoundecaprenol N-acetyl-beta-D-mannosaminyltransferase
MSEQILIWGLPLSPMTMAEAVDSMELLIAAGRPAFVITANLNYAMLTANDSRLAALNDRAALVFADGAPLVWASRWAGTPLPERVAGSDLIFALSERAARKGFRVFFLGGAPGVADEAAARLSQRYPGLEVAGTASPRQLPPPGPELDSLVAQVRSARPHILFAALGQPKGEFWLSEFGEALGVPLALQVGAALDFAAGRVRRAPLRLQRLGLEWAYRLWLEPSRLGLRYARNAAFFLHYAGRDLANGVFRPRRSPDHTTSAAHDATGLTARSSP